MKNLFYSLFIVLATALTAQSQTPAITMTTTTAVGSTFTFYIGVNSNPIQVDWGNGTLFNFSGISSSTAISGTLTGSTIKIYGSSIIYLKVFSKNLTALDVSNALVLENLDCSYNYLTNLDVSNNTILKSLSCYSNQLETLLLPNSTTLNFLDCYSNHLSVLDVTKNTSLNDLNCGSNWLVSLDVTQNTALEILKCSSNGLTTLDVTKNTALTTLECRQNGITALDVSKNTKLTSFECYGNYLTALNVTNNTDLKIFSCGLNDIAQFNLTNNVALTEVECSYNQLSTLDVTNNIAITKLMCEGNNLTTLYLPNTSSLTELNCNSNNLTFSTLPVKQASWITYSYSPQSIVLLSDTEYAINETLDLSSQLTVESNITTYTWKTLGGETLVKDIDYSEDNGYFTFLTDQGDYIYCLMTNASFPDLTLRTQYISVTSQLPSIKMITSKTIGNTFSFRIGGSNANLPFQVDWGNGILKKYSTTFSSNFYISDTLKGNTIIIYGLGITHLDVKYCKLTSIDVSKLTALKELDCSWNQLTQLNVSNNKSLRVLYCQSNELSFGTLPTINPTWTSYNYSPQSVFQLPKSIYYTNDTINLSNQLIVGSNTTTYVWKDKYDVTLTKNIDYTEDNGKFIFLKGLASTVYCQMTNSSFLDLTITTNSISILSVDPAIAMTTSIPVDSLFSFSLGASGWNSSVFVDFGTDTLKSISMYSNNVPISDTLRGSTVKIYGSDITSLNVQSAGLIALNTSKATLLETLNCSNNHLTSLDVTKNDSLKNLYCDMNHFTFLSLPLIQTNWIVYDYSPQQKLELQKSVYGPSDTIDLSRYLTANGNPTTYGCETYHVDKLTSGIDYNVTNGVISFLKSQADSVRCRMTNPTFPNLTLYTSFVQVTGFSGVESEASFSINIFPNPVQEYLYIECPENISKIEIYTITGAKIYEQYGNSVHSFVVTSELLPRGMFFVKVFARNLVITKKMMKEY